jgi:hypothetical protein
LSCAICQIDHDDTEESATLLKQGVVRGSRSARPSPAEPMARGASERHGFACSRSIFSWRAEIEPARAGPPVAIDRMRRVLQLLVSESFMRPSKSPNGRDRRQKRAAAPLVDNIQRIDVDDETRPLLRGYDADKIRFDGLRTALRRKDRRLRFARLGCRQSRLSRRGRTLA